MIFLKTITKNNNNQLSYVLLIIVFFGLNGNLNYRDSVLCQPLSNGSKIYSDHTKTDIYKTDKFLSALSCDKHLLNTENIKRNKVVNDEEKQDLLVNTSVHDDIKNNRNHNAKEVEDREVVVLSNVKLNNAVRDSHLKNLGKHFLGLNEFIEKTNSLQEIIKELDHDVNEKNNKFKKIPRKHVVEDIGDFKPATNRIKGRNIKFSHKYSEIQPIFTSTNCPIRKAYCSSGYEDAGAWTPPKPDKNSVITVPAIHFEITTNGKCKYCHYLYKDAGCNTLLTTSTCATTSND